MPKCQTDCINEQMCLFLAGSGFNTPGPTRAVAATWSMFQFLRPRDVLCTPVRRPRRRADDAATLGSRKLRRRCRTQTWYDTRFCYYDYDTISPVVHDTPTTRHKRGDTIRYSWYLQLRLQVIRLYEYDTIRRYDTNTTVRERYDTIHVFPFTVDLRMRSITIFENGLLKTNQIKKKTLQASSQDHLEEVWAVLTSLFRLLHIPIM